jgi:hypothetical protein
MERINDYAVWVRNYSDVSPCIELLAVFDDALKKDDKFGRWAVYVANRIIEDLGLYNCKATYGKWGARLETAKNRKLTEMELSICAREITNHPSWLNLKLSTYVFTYGKMWEEHTKLSPRRERSD